METNPEKKADSSRQPKKYFFYGAFGFSVMVHIALLLIIGGVVLIEQSIPTAPFRDFLPDGENEVPVVDEEEVTMKDPGADELSADEASGASGASGETSPISDVLTVDNVPSLFTASPVASPALTSMPGSGTGTAGLGSGGGGNGGRPGGRITIFGGDQKTAESFEAIFYDTKQTKSGKPTGDGPKYAEIVLDFVNSGFKPALLSKYFQSGPLYPTRLAIPFTSSSEAVKAFDVVGKAEPTNWIVHYHGKIKAPKSGTFRFAGYGDDFLYVALDGKMVLDGCHELLKGQPTKLKGKDPNSETIVGWMAYGKWVDLVQGQTYEFDVAIGDYGVSFGVALFVQEKGVNYSKDSGGRLILPVFRTGDPGADRIGRYPADTSGLVFSP